MDQADNGTRQRSSNRQERGRRIDHGFIEEINRSPQGTLITISYPVPGKNNIVKMELMILAVSSRTKIQDHRGNRMQASQLQVGLRIDAIVSERTTFSIPPQVQAYQIIVRDQRQEFAVTQGRILNIDKRLQRVLVGDRANPMGNIYFNVTEDTIIQDRRGVPLRLERLRVGMVVRVEHAIFQTLSIPPQSTAYVIEVR